MPGRLVQRAAGRSDVAPRSATGVLRFSLRLVLATAPTQQGEAKQTCAKQGQACGLRNDVWRINERTASGVPPRAA
jgi:hypothetical protein